jgi:hypothetical protein
MIYYFNSIKSTGSIKTHILNFIPYFEDINEEVCKAPTDITGIKNSTVIIIKSYDKINETDYEILKQNNNVLILICSDMYCINSMKSYIRQARHNHFYDYVFFPNYYMLNSFKASYPNSKHFVFYHPIDYNFYPTKSASTEFSPAYIGNIKSKLNIELTKKLIKNKEIPFIHYLENKIECLKYNCHISLRLKPKSDYKPGAKLSAAHALDANIIMTPDKSFTEILPDYPYYTDDLAENFDEIFEKCQSDYGTSRWNDALELIRNLDEIIHPSKIFEVYREVLGK